MSTPAITGQLNRGFNKPKPRKKFRLSEGEYITFIFTALSMQTGCPSRATNKYLNIIKTRILREGPGFLKILSAYPILGLRVLGNDEPLKQDFGFKVRKNNNPRLFAWYFARLRELSKAQPTRANTLLVRRILTVLSIGKMLKASSNFGLKKAKLLYAQRAIKRVNGDKVSEYLSVYRESFESFLQFTRFSGYSPEQNHRLIVPVKGLVSLDPSCYSLKSLVKRSNKRFKTEIPDPVSKYLLRSTTEDSLLRPTGKVDGRMMIIVENGGKYRGICPYYSPLVHSTSVYGCMRSILYGWIPDCSLDQSVGHERARYLSSLGVSVVSADASNFTDSLDLDLVAAFMEVCGQGEFLDYLSSLRISSALGIISTPLPLMGLKGCFEVGCVMLAWSLWEQSRKRSISLDSLCHACDDVCGLGLYDGFELAYNNIGASLNRRKTVVSNSTTVFCGQMYWKGTRVTPVRLDITKFANSRSGQDVIPAARMFMRQAPPVWGRFAIRQAYSMLTAACKDIIRPGSINFNVPVKLGGLPPVGCRPFWHLLERPEVLRYCLYNIPLDKGLPDASSSMIGIVRLGKCRKMPDGRLLPSITLPSTEKADWRYRKRKVDLGIKLGLYSVTDVYEYFYSDTPLAS